MIQALKDIDVSFFLWFNGKHNEFLDTVMYWASHKYFWIWFYVFLLALVFVKLGRKVLVVLPTVALLILFSDQSSGVIKRTVQRERPCHSKFLRDKVHLNPECGGKYGFVSS